MTNMSIQPLWLTYFIEILLVIEFQLTKTYFGTFSCKAHFRPQISSNGTVSHKGMVELQKIKREKRLQRREERRERALALQRGMSTRVTDKERNLVESDHDRQEEGVEEEASPMEEDLWIEQREAL